MKYILMITIFLGLIPACKDDNRNNLLDANSVTDKVWTLRQIQNTSTNVITNYPDIPEKITIAFAGDNQLIFDGVCNTGGGKYTLDNDKLTISALALTKMYCSNIDWESTAGNGLIKAYQYRLSDGKLVILSNAGFNLIFE